MMHNNWHRRGVIKAAVGALAAAAIPTKGLAQAKSISRIAFGSCAEQNKPQPIWGPIQAQHPDIFLFLGDNIYGDTRQPEVLAAKYRQLSSQPGFQRLRGDTPILATWDDHDYGENDAGADYPIKQISKELFLDFFGEPSGTERRLRHDGIYTAQLFGPPGRRVQIIMLDTRYARTPLLRVDRLSALTRRARSMGPYQPRINPEARMLSDRQWLWLEDQLRAPADFRILCSSTPVLMDFTGWETWANMPGERQRLQRLITTTGATGLVIISGDVHRAELSHSRSAVPYPLWELTSSGLTKTWPYAAPNVTRIAVYHGRNFGTIEIDWDQSDPTITLCAHNATGMAVISHTLRRGDLQPPP
ncbi:MAG: alkaline phosphatase D family protein [Alphaproteobacteria bacterium]